MHFRVQPEVTPGASLPGRRASSGSRRCLSSFFVGPLTNRDSIRWFIHDVPFYMRVFMKSPSCVEICMIMVWAAGEFGGFCEDYFVFRILYILFSMLLSSKHFQINNVESYHLPMCWLQNILLNFCENLRWSNNFIFLYWNVNAFVSFHEAF